MMNFLTLMKARVITAGLATQVRFGRQAVSGGWRQAVQKVWKSDGEARNEVACAVGVPA